MLLSKMHYASELASSGNKVYFVNPPVKRPGQNKLVTVNAGIQKENLTVIDIRPVKFSLFFRHKLPFIFNKISESYIKGIRDLVHGEIDEVWCFNPHMFTSLKKFNAKVQLLLLYDLYKTRYIFKLGETVNGLITVSQLILDYYKSISVPKLLLQHGLSRYFAEIAVDRLNNNNFDRRPGEKIKVGYVGNLLREGMDITTAREIIEQHPDKEFHFWGPHTLKNNNVAAPEPSSNDILAFVDFLRNQKNVFLRGVIEPPVLAKEINEMDCFLFLYLSHKDPNMASNSHKILEYLSTGKAVISTYVSGYHDADLLEMCGPDGSENLPVLFSDITNNLVLYNSPQKQKQRIAYALDNTYARQIERIQNFVATAKNSVKNEAGAGKQNL
jgi:glycosyltransferase involved in cell wall biosynthesis